MKKAALLILAVTVISGGLLLTAYIENQYFYFSTYIVLQYIILATAWNILGGYTGYVNFGTGAYFGLGAYTAGYLITNFNLPLPWLIVAGGTSSAVLGLAIGYLTLRLKGVYFSIATLAMSIVIATLIINTPALGGAKGMYILRPKEVSFFSNYMELLFATMVIIAVLTVALAWFIENSWFGRGLAAIRDDEVAAACNGVPVLRLKVLSATTSGALMGIAGAPYPYYISYMEPLSTISLDMAVNSLAMPLIGGTGTWIGPVLGAILLSTTQQVATVTISSEYNLLIVGILLVGFVILAPNGLVGLFQSLLKRRTD